MPAQNDFQSEHVLARLRGSGAGASIRRWPSLPSSVVRHAFGAEHGLPGDVVSEGVTVAEDFRLEGQPQVRQDPLGDARLARVA